MLNHHWLGSGEEHILVQIHLSANWVKNDSHQLFCLVCELHIVCLFRTKGKNTELIHFHRKNVETLKKKKKGIRKQMNIMTFLTLNHMLPDKCLSLKNCTNEAIWRLLWTTASSLKIKWMMLMWLILVQGVMQKPENTLVIFIIKLNQHFKEMPVLSLVY